MTYSCPIRLVIDEIYQGGQDADPAGNVFFFGGDEHVAAEATYYINLRKIEMARFIATKPDLTQARAKFQQWYGGLRSSGAWSSKSTSCADLRQRVLNHLITSGQAASIQRLLARIYETIEQYEDYLIALGEPTLSLPEFALPVPNLQDIYLPEVLNKIADGILRYINHLCRADFSCPGAPRPPESAAQSLPQIYLDRLETPEAALGAINEMLQLEIKAAEELATVEQYQCAVMDILGQAEAKLSSKINAAP